MNPVNQRGQTSTNADWQCWLDRWIVNAANSALTLTDNGVKFNCGTDGHNSRIIQRVPFNTIDPAKTYTVAICDSDGNVACKSGAPFTSLFFQGNYLQFNEGDGSTYYYFILDVYTDITIRWLALYEGEFTAETLPEYQPKEYAAELAECRRYFRKYDSWDGLCTGYIDWQHHLWIFIPTDIPMRVNPTCSNIAGSIVVNGTYITLDTTPTAVQRNGLIALSFPGFQVAADHGSQPATIVLGENGLTLSADL